MDIYNQNAYSIDVGTRLRQLREERNMSMRSLATASGLSANALSMIERGKTSPSVSTLYKLADAMGVPITTFFGEQTTKQQAIFIRSQERPRVPFSRGVWEGRAVFRSGRTVYADARKRSQQRSTYNDPQRA